MLFTESVTVHAVVVTFYDMAGNVGGSAPFPVFPSVVNPGQTVPFDVTIFDDKKTPFNPFTDTSQVKYQIDWASKVEQ